MTSRKRKAIRKDEYLAAALACLLPPTLRDVLRARKVPASHVISLFQCDHIRLHALEHDDPDVDKWFNLDPMLSGPHREKSRRDTAIVAKVKRIIAKQARPALTAIAGEPGGKRRAVAGPKRKIARRASPWPPKGSRPMRCKNATPERRV